jgi:Cytidylyltransferase family
MTYLQLTYYHISFTGAIGGVISCMICSMTGANLMQWPFWALTGSSYGIMLAVIALVGDLTASMMKRDANMFTAPAAFFFCQNVLTLAMKIKVTVKQFPLFFS